MAQRWVIYRKSDGVALAIGFMTPSASEPPSAACFDGWNGTTMAAAEIDGFDEAWQVWNPTTKALEANLDALKAFKLRDVNARRLEAESAGCNTAFGIVDSDERSRGLISGAVQMALIAKIGAQPFSESWTMHDNSQVEFDADEMIAMGVTVGIYISAVHARGVAIKAEVEAAADTATLDAIDITTGWPS